MRIPIQARRQAKELFLGCMADGRLDETKARQTVGAVLKQKPRRYLAVLMYFKRLIELELDRRTARVESVSVLNPQLQESVKDNLTQRYGPGLQFAFAENPALIGGVRVQVGSDVYDGSIRGRLAKLQESF